MRKYLEVPYVYKNKEGISELVLFIIPLSFINGSESLEVMPDRFFGVDLKKLVEIKQ